MKTAGVTPGEKVSLQSDRTAIHEIFNTLADLDYYKNKSERGPGYFPEFGEDNRRFYLRKGEVPMRYIDRPKERSLSAMIAHPSERQWNLPKSHKRHLMKLRLGNFPLGMMLVGLC
jgi:hypothetical protein